MQNSPSIQDILTSLTTPKIAQILISKYNTLSELSQAPIEELKNIKGIGPKKAQQLQSAFDLARSLSREIASTKPLIDNPENIAALFREEAKAYNVEKLQIVLLNTRKKLIKILTICTGTLDSISVDQRSIFKPAILANAATIILTHNHPSGDPTPSEADIRVTRELQRAGKLLKIEIIDHIIIGRATMDQPKDYTSLRELGYFE